MPLLIRGGTVVNHDHSRRADVLIDGETIVAVGATLDAPAGAEIIDAGGCYVMPGGIDPHTHLEMPFMGTRHRRRFRVGHQGGAGRRHHHGGRFLHSRSRAIDARGLSGLAAQVREGGLRLRLPHGGDVVVEAGVRRDGDRGQDLRHQHLQALHGLQGRADGERRRALQLVRALRPSRRACRWCMPRTATSSPACRRRCWRAASPGPRATPIRARPRSRARPPTAPS